MNFFNIKNPFKRAVKGTEETIPPLKSGRVSESEGSSMTLGSMITEMMTVDPSFQFELLKALENLAMYNADVSYAIENIVTLGNTDFEIEFDDFVSDEDKKKMLMSIKHYRDKWYGYSDGLNSLVNDLLSQCAINGCISSEIIPSDDLRSVKKAVLVNPYNIRFIYDEKLDEYLPYQQSKKVGGTANLIKLNTATYKYISLRRYSEKPYGIPPFLSALENIVIEKTLVENLKYVTKKLGVLGFLKVLVSAPSKKVGEKDEEWYNRCQTYLNGVVPEIEKSMNKGYVVGFKDTHEFSMENVSTNVQGAKDLFQLNSEFKMSGLKQDPMMLGRNWSTTETLGRVILIKLSSQVENYQRSVASYLTQLFKLHLLLQGFRFEYLNVKFEQPTLIDKSKEEDAYSKKITNANLLYENGIISQQQRAEMLGFEKPDQEKPRNPMMDLLDEEDTDSKKTDPANDKDTESNWRELDWIKERT